MIRIHSFALACACAAAAVPAGAHACSLSTFPVFGGSATLIATATADTLPAGPGGVRYEADPRRPRAPREVYGQVVRVERLGSAAARALPPGTDRVVLVPWDLAPDCTRLPWSASARWLQPGARGLFNASLRDPAHWVDGLPTLDVGQPWTQPYPADVMVRHQRGTLLTVEEAFALLEALPTHEEHTGRGEQAWTRLREWVGTHPQLACRYPATEVLRTAEDVGGVPLPDCGTESGTAASVIHPPPAGRGEAGENRASGGAAGALPQ